MTKICSKCGEPLPADLEHFQRHNQKKGGLRPECKICSHKRKWTGSPEAKADWKKRNRKRVNAHAAVQRALRDGRIVQRMTVLGYRLEKSIADQIFDKGI